MIEHYCNQCETFFELESQSAQARCPECLRWDTNPVYISEGEVVESH